MKELLAKCLLSACGFAPMLEGYQVWSGRTAGDKDLTFPSEMAHASIKGFNVAIESIPESFIQMTAFIGMQLDEISTINRISLIASFLASGFVQTEGNFGITRSMLQVASGNPFFQWISGEKKRLYKSMGGMFLFSSCFSFLFVFTMSTLKHARSFTSVAKLVGTEIASTLLYKAYQGELFGYLMIKKPGFLNSLVGVLLTAIYVILTSTAPLIASSNPNELGPHVFTSILLWRLVSSPVILYYSSIKIAKEGSSWLTTRACLSSYFFAMIGCVFGLWLFLANLDEDFDISMFWKPKSGKQFIGECFTDVRLNYKISKNKDDDKWVFVGSKHPLYVPKNLVCDFVEEIAIKFEKKVGEGGKEVVNEPEEKGISKSEKKKNIVEEKERPEWLTEEVFGMRIVEVFKYYGDKDMISKTNAFLDRLFQEGWRDEVDNGKGNKVHPGGDV